LLEGLNGQLDTPIKINSFNGLNGYELVLCPPLILSTGETDKSVSAVGRPQSFDFAQDKSAIKIVNGFNRWNG